MRTYQHSLAFEAVKNTKEAISDNLTSLHYLQTLDKLLWDALEPVQRCCPSLFFNYVAKIVAHQTLRTSTKFTSLSNEERMQLPLHLFHALATQDLAHVRKMHINRGLLFGFLSWFRSKTKAYEKLYRPSDVDEATRKQCLDHIERELGVVPGQSLYGTIQQMAYWDAKARWFKSLVMEKYHRTTINQAQRTYKDYNHVVPLDDVIQIYLVVLSRAIDRCDPRLGVLTTFISNWFKSARSEVADLARVQNDVSLDAMAEEYGDAVSDIFGHAEFDTSAESVEYIAWVSKTMDHQGYIRASLGIPEWVTPEQRSKLETFARE